MEIKLKPNKHDIFIGSVLLAFVIALVISLATLKTSSDHYVYVKYDGEIVHTMDLNVDEVFIMHQDDERYKGLHGDFEITVKNGKVSITKNTCPQDFCKHLGAISFKGQALVCAPNSVVVEIGKKDNSNCDWGVCYEN
jgi:hypothetical protein